MSIDAKRFRQVLGHFPTGVAVVTGMDRDRQPVGMAVGSFTSVSLDPPLVGFLPDRSSTSWPRIRDAGAFCVNVLAAEQESICRAFAVSGKDKFAGLSWRPGRTGAPILDGVVAWIDCAIEAVHEAGDHWIVIGRVLELDVSNPTLPLVFFQGGYGRFTPLSLAAWEGDLVIQMRSADLARPQMEALAEELDVECVASAVVGDEMVLVANASTLRSRTLPPQVGQRIPFEPPLGTAFVAFAPPAAEQAWFERLGPDPGDDTVTALRRTVDAVRRHGYSVGRGATWHAEVGTVLARAKPERPAPDTVETMRRLIRSLPPDYESPEPRPGGEDDVQTMSAPVFGPTGAVVLVLSLLSAGRRIPASRVAALSTRLRQAADTVTTALAGQPAQ